MLATVLALTLVSLQAAPSPDSPRLSVEALVSPLKGKIQLVQENHPIPLPVGSWTLLKDSATLQFSSDAEAMVLCPDGSCRLLKESSTFDRSVCTSRAQEPCEVSLQRTSDPIHEKKRLVRLPLTAENIELAKKQLELWALFLLHGELRGRPRDPTKHWGYLPELISPRCPDLGQRPRDCEAWVARPRQIRFLGVEKAETYHFELSGPSRFEPQSIQSRDITCKPWSAFAAQTMCTVTWPESWSLPTDGATVRLKIKAEVDGRLRVVQHPTVLRQLPKHEAHLISEELNVSKALPQALAEPWRHLIFLRAGLISELHADLLEKAHLSTVETMVLAKISLSLGSPRAALYYFTQVARELHGNQSLLRAEAEIGLSRCTLELDDWEASRTHLEAAENIYQQLGDDAGLNAVARLRKELALLTRH